MIAPLIVGIAIGLILSDCAWFMFIRNAKRRLERKYGHKIELD